MPPRYAYWTIILDGSPTSFRTKEREEILPLFNQLRAKNPAAMLKWFSGGRLWDSPEQAKEIRGVEKVRRFREERARDTKEQRELEAREMAAFREKHGRPPDGSDQKLPEGFDRGQGSSAPRAGENRDRDRRAAVPGGSRAPSDRRGKDWRPGGEHRDPRDKYKLPPGEARKRWKDRNLGPKGPKPFGSKPAGGRPFGDQPRGDRPFSGKPGGDRPSGDRPRSDRPHGKRPGGAPSTLRQAQGGAEQGRGTTRGWNDRAIGAGRPRGPKPFGGKPKGPGGPRPFGAKPKPFSGRPRGPKPPGGPRRRG